MPGKMIILFNFHLEYKYTNLKFIKRKLRKENTLAQGKKKGKKETYVVQSKFQNFLLSVFAFRNVYVYLYLFVFVCSEKKTI